MTILVLQLDLSTRQVTRRFLEKVERSLLPRQGCSRFFIAGKLECRDVDALTADLERLRKEVVADPFFKDVPSLDPARKRTAVHFHAKDDPPEVRFMVYKLLAQDRPRLPLRPYRP